MSNINIIRESDLKSVNVRNPGGNVTNVSVRQPGRIASIDDFTQKEIEGSDNIGLEFFSNEDKRIQEPEDEESEEESEDQEDPMMDQRFTVPDRGDYEDERPVMTHEEMMQKKAFFLSQLKRLETKGYTLSRKLGIEHSLDVIEGEVIRIKKEIELENGVNFCKQGLMACVLGIEMFNKKFDPIGAKLNGWSNAFTAQQHSYDEVLEILYEKYASKVQMLPEIQLILMISGSAAQYHLQQSFMDTALNTNDIMANIMKKQKMKGPSSSTEDLLQKLANDSDSQNSSVVYESEEEADEPEEVIRVPIKRRGRPPKKNN
jgi:hypothetical protein